MEKTAGEVNCLRPLLGTLLRIRIEIDPGGLYSIKD
jgi:hypothetical protein